MDTPLIALLKKLAPEDAEMLVTSLGDTVLRSTRVALMEALPEEHLAGFEEVLKSEDADKIETYLKEYIPEYEQVVMGAVEGLRLELESVLDALQP